MKKILVPTDFSENAYNALKYGVKLFPDEECVFYLLHTYNLSIYNSEILVSPDLSIDDIYRMTSLKSLTKVVNRIKRESPDKKHRFRKIASIDLLQDAIKNIVKTKKIDLVLMGTQGATGAAKILFGTHTVDAIKEAVCPLLAIPDKYNFTSPKKILFPSGFEFDIQEENLQILMDIAEKFQSKVHILHIKQKAPMDKEKERIKKALVDNLKDTSHTFHICENQTVPQGIFQFQEKNKIDLLVMVKHQHSFFQNLFSRPVINKIGMQIKTPFLILPALNKENKQVSYEKDPLSQEFFI